MITPDHGHDHSDVAIDVHPALMHQTWQAPEGAGEGHGSMTIAYWFASIAVRCPTCLAHHRHAVVAEHSAEAIVRIIKHVWIVLTQANPLRRHLASVLHDTADPTLRPIVSRIDGTEEDLVPIIARMDQAQREVVLELVEDFGRDLAAPRH